MVIEEGTGVRDGEELTLAVKCLKSEEVNNGLGPGVWNDVAEGRSLSDGFRTYKRRKLTKLSSESKAQEDHGVYVETASRLVEQTVKEPCNVTGDSNSCDQIPLPTNGIDGCPQNHWRNFVLEQIYQSLGDNEGGVRQCIRDPLHSRADCTTKVRKFDCQGKHKNNSYTGSISNGTQKAANVEAGIMSNGSLGTSNRYSLAEKCRHAFLNVIVSQKFSSLCKLLFENFQGIKADSFLDFSLINSRMKEGAYENSPMLFTTDIQQVWGKLQWIGTELITLATDLSDLSRTSYHEQVGVSVHNTVERKNNEKGTWESSEPRTKTEQTDDCAVYEVSSCRHCGGKADGRDCLVCDSCEEMYHISCIEPAVKEIPLKSWYCASCTASGIGSPHEKCVVCETLNAHKTQTNGDCAETVSPDERTDYQVEENSDYTTHLLMEMQKFGLCKICGNEVEYGDKFRICGHPFCPNKFYHARCLASKQLKAFGPSWYCPSCLCRACLTDQDDDKIVLCDGCDHAYHIYCLRPPRTSIPKGKWFCRKCDAGIRAIRRARKAYENFEFKLEHNGEDESDKSRGGMDMLLTAANTLNYEENLAAFHMKS